MPFRANESGEMVAPLAKHQDSIGNMLIELKLYEISLKQISWPTLNNSYLVAHFFGTEIRYVVI